MEKLYLCGYGLLYRSDGSWKKTGLQGEVVVKPIFEGYTFIPASRRVRTTEKEVDFQTAPSELTTLKMRPDVRSAILENQRITLSVVPKDQYGQRMYLPVTWSLLTENGQLSSLEGEEVQFTATSPGLGVVEAYIEDKKVRFERDITYTLSGVVTDAHGEVLPGVTIIYLENHTYIAWYLAILKNIQDVKGNNSRIIYCFHLVESRPIQCLN